MRTLVGALVLTLVAGCESPPGVAVDEDTARLTGAITSAAQSMNAQRTARGLEPLSRSPALTAAAQSHAADMAAKGFFSHVSSNGANVMQRVRRQGYRACLAAENIARGQQTQAAALESWMSSPPHRRNILSRRATDFGIARASGSQGPVWVMVFGRSC